MKNRKLLLYIMAIVVTVVLETIMHFAQHRDLTTPEFWVMTFVIYIMYMVEDIYVYMTKMEPVNED